MSVEPAMTDADVLVSLADLAEMAGVTRPAVSNWRRRNPDDFPSPVAETGATSLFRLSELTKWMARHGKRLDARSVDQLIWSAVNPARGDVLPENAAQAGMILLGYAALARRLDGAGASELRIAVAANDRQMLDGFLEDLDEYASRIGLGQVFPPRSAPSWSQDSRAFLGVVLDLALEHSLSEAFEALIAAAGRGSRGAGEHTTPLSIARLIMSMAAPVRGVVIDPACGYGTLLTAASRAAAEPLTLIGQDINAEACQITRLRMLVHGRPADVIKGDTLRAASLFEDATPMGEADADLVVVDPPFGLKWHPEQADKTKRMPYGLPPAGHADMAWLQDGISRLRPGGVAMFVLGPGAAFRDGAEGEIRRRLIESRCIRAIVALPPGLYPHTSIPVTLWIASRPRDAGQERPGDGSVLLIDASQLGNSHRRRTELTSADVAAIAGCFHAWDTRAEISAGGRVRATAVPVTSLLATGGNLSPARWIQDPADDPEQRLKRVAAAQHDLTGAGIALSEASFSVPPLVAGYSDQPGGEWPKRKVTDLAALIRPRRIDPDLIGTGATPFIRASDIGPDLTVSPSYRIDLDRVPGPVQISRPGDVVVVVDGAKPRAAVDLRGGAVVGAPLQVLRPGSSGPAESMILAALITSIGPGYVAGTTAPRMDLTALEIPCPDNETAQWLGQALMTLAQQRREALAAAQAIDKLRTELVDGLGSQAIRLELPPGGRL
jgi:type I restriction-modification system DNA methylase subunit/predicted DNA-binding transcriptional regulator AlpA